MRLASSTRQRRPEGRPDRSIPRVQLPVHPESHRLGRAGDRKRALPLLGAAGRVVNLSSAAQAPVNVQALKGGTSLDDMGAYAQSKLAITLWTRELAKQLPSGPLLVAVNPGSLLGTKMVKEGFGHSGKDVGIGAQVLIDAAFGEAFAGRSGQYFDNDARRFSDPHPAALRASHAVEVMAVLEAMIPADAQGEVSIATGGQ